MSEHSAKVQENNSQLQSESNNSSGSAAKPRRSLGRPKDVPSLALIKDQTRKNYHATYKEIFQDGALDRKTKELIAIAASAITGCEGCLIGHIRRAKALGASMDEIKEAIGVAFSVNAASVVDHTDVVAALMNLQGE